MSETTPLLSEAAVVELAPPKDAYGRFSTAQKRAISTVVSLAGLLALFASESFVPCVPEIAKDFNTVGAVINYTVGAYMFTLAIGNLVFAPYAGFYGRRLVYLILLPTLCIGCLIASVSANVFQLAIGRTLQGLGASCLIPVGAATVSDIYRLENRGTAMGRYFGVVLMGTALAPIFGGICATYASWRIMQLALSIMGLVSFVSIAMYLPETSHPGTRGIEKQTDGLENSGLSPGMNREWKWVWLNPLSSVIKILRDPNIFSVTLASSFILMTFFVLMLPLSYTLGTRYGITSPALIGLCLLPSGTGSIVGSMLGGRLADHAVVRGFRKRGGKWVPEDRLNATLSGALLLVPLSVLIFGLTTQFVPGRLGLFTSLTCLFMNGVGVGIVRSPADTYTVDVLRNSGAEAVAVVSAFRNVLAAAAAATVLPTINRIGVAHTNALVALMAWLAFGLLLMTIKYGDTLRDRLDLRCTTSFESS